MSARLIDRSLRPLFPNNYRCETQIICNILAIDSHNLPDIAAINAASTALCLSDIPWFGPVGAVRIGMSDGQIIVNPTRKELQSSNLDLVVTATKQNMVVMLEGKGNIILQQDLLKAIKHGTKEAQKIINGIEEIQKTYGKEKRTMEVPTTLPVEISEAVKTLSEMRLREVFCNSHHDKISRDQAVAVIRSSVVERVWSSYPDVEPTLIQDEFNSLLKYIFRELIFETNQRCDGRGCDDLRNISCEIEMHKPLHGSALFQRGQTQVLCTVALDSQESALKLDTLTALET